MGDKWKEYKIDDIGRIVTGKTPPTAEPENYGGILPFITPSDMKGQKYIDNAERTISLKGIEYLKNLLLPPKTVFVSCIGSDMGKVGMTKVESVTNQQINSIIVKGGIDPDYVYYNFYSRKEELQRLATSGSAQPILNKGHFSQLKIIIPPISEQKAIASILGALDDKIELNRKMNETLEAMARAIFKSWFVDFGPIPGFGPHKEWQNSPLGKIPKGWRVGTIEDLGHVICGKTPPTADSENYGIEMPFITIPDMHGQIFIIDTEKKLSRRGVSTQPSKTLPALSVCVSCIATPGLVVLTTEPSQTNQQINSVIHRDGISPYYCYMTLSELAHEIKARGSGGSVTLNLNKTQFATLPILLPDGSAINNFHKIVEPLFDKIFLKAKQFLTLAAIRDALLPKLLSGEIRVKDN